MMRLRLRTKITLGVALIVGVALAAAGALSFVALRHEHLAGLQQRALALTRPIVYRTQETLNVLGPSAGEVALQGLATDVSLIKDANPDLVYVAAVDPAGRILAHSDPTQVNQTIIQSLRPAAASAEPRIVGAGQAIHTIVPVAAQGKPVFALLLGHPGAPMRAKAHAIVWWSLGMGAILTTLGSLAGSLVVRRWVLQPVELLSTAAQAVAAGRLTQDLHPRGTDEVGRLEGAFAEMVGGLRALVSAVRGGADEVAGASRGIAGTATQTAAGAEGAAAAVEQMTATMHEVNATIRSVAEHAGSAAASVSQTSAAMAQLATSIERVAGEAERQTRAADRALSSLSTQEEASNSLRGGLETTVKAAEDLGGAIRALGAKARDIDAIVEVIDDLAEQTNLLALNAAIEAARAGEHGAGFAVVAEEVRRLAERSAASAKEIGGLVRGIQSGAEATAEKMQATSEILTQALTHSSRARQARGPVREGLEDLTARAQQIQAATIEQRQGSREIAAAADRLAAMLAEIRSATEEQSAGTAQVVKALEKIREVAAGNAAAAAELSASVTQLSSQTGLLQRMVARFEAGNGHPPVAAPRDTAAEETALREGWNR
ncbi:MAG TPA: methyl-accepting chemotaxis protein [Candidatus Sulfotelmatobacter sp.]|nr:methyl-accepting chemotaxis protein [Candidatus Sulfotelmatobacter sp.]